MMDKRANQYGTSLLELVFVILVASFGVMAIYRVWSYYIQTEIRFEQMTYTLDKLEWLANGISLNKLCKWEQKTESFNCQQAEQYNVLAKDEKISVILGAPISELPTLHQATVKLSSTPYPSIPLLVEK